MSDAAPTPDRWTLTAAKAIQAAADAAFREGRVWVPGTDELEEIIWGAARAAGAGAVPEQGPALPLGADLNALLNGYGLNIFGAQLLGESFLRRPDAQPIHFTVPIRRKDCPGFVGVHFTLHPIPEV
jgi:hypothetical protein